MSNTILVYAPVSYAGMGPYVASIINSFSPNDDIFFILIENESKYYSKNIKTELKDKCIIYEQKYSRVRELSNLIFSYPNPGSDIVKNTIKKNGIKTVHYLTPVSDIRLTKWISKRCNLITTVHDLDPHEAKKALHKMWRQHVLYKRMFKTLELSNVLVTNNITQLRKQQVKYPSHTHDFYDFPTLMTPIVANGNTIAPEIKDIDNYFLFFGRIEAYKGVELLIASFIKLKNQGLLKDRKLVIAGKGQINCTYKHKDIIIVNRYIGDDEIALLYKKASFIVYPYISATLSGVLSIATWFHKPMILSNISFFRDVANESEAAIWFDHNELNSLDNALQAAENAINIESMQNSAWQIYEDHYSDKQIHNQLLEIYERHAKQPDNHSKRSEGVAAG